MINILKQGSSLLITSDNNQFPWRDGKMSVPLNSIAYIIDESDYVTFRSVANNDILFTSLIGELKINDESVSKDDLITMFDSVANSSGSGGGGTASAGVNSINGFQGDVRIKTVNGKSLIGSGDIEIKGGSDIEEYVKKINVNLDNSQIIYYYKNTDGDSSTPIMFKTLNGESLFGMGDIEIKGGSSVEESDPIFTKWKNGSSIAIGQNNTASYNGVNIGVDNGDANASILIGQYLSGNSGSIIIGADTKSYNDGEILLGNAASSIEGETHVAFAKYGSSYGAEQNCFEITRDNSIYIWNADNTQMIKLQDHLGGGGGSVEESDPIFTEWKDDTSIVCGNGAVNGINSFGALIKRDNAVAIGNGASIQTDNSIAIGNNAKTFGSTASTLKGLVAIGNEVSVSAIANDSTINKYVKTNINNQLKFATDDTMYIKGMSTNGTSNNWFIVNGEWTGTQSQYDALGTYYNNVTYNIIEG